MIEDVEHGCIPLHLGDYISSLSAILLNSTYYQLLLTGKMVINDVVILSTQNLIPFKAKAWIDLSERKEQGYQVDERDIKKHKNDVIRLTAILSGSERCELLDEIKSDMERFVDCLEKEPLNHKVLKIPGISFYDIIQMLRKVYL